MSSLVRNYNYHRRLPHFQKVDHAIFVTFRKLNREPFAANVRDVILQHCLHDDGKRFILHAAVVMPNHVHLLLTPLRDEQGWPHALPAILKLVKGVSARSVNKLLGSSGPVWQDESLDHVVRSDESFAEKLEYIQQNPVGPGWWQGRKSIRGYGSRRGSQVQQQGQRQRTGVSAPHEHKRGATTTVRCRR